MRILSLESSAQPASCAVTEDGKILAAGYVHIRQTHSETLLPMAEQILQAAGLTPDQLDAFAVTNGPGSFTGVRIGVAAVKGLAFPGNKPCVAVSTLEAMAENLRHVSGFICACMDARCGQVYNAIFRSDGETVTRLCEDRAMALTDLKAELLPLAAETPVYFVGDGAGLAFRETGLSKGVLASEALRYQNATGVAMVAHRKLTAGETCTAAALMPAYLRLPQAERELKAKLSKQKES